MTDGGLLHDRGDLRVFTEGVSMYHTLKPHDRLLVRAYGPQEEICIGDVVAFRSPVGKGVVVHRIVKADAEGRLWTRGDNVFRNDPFSLGRTNIIGRVTCAYRGRKEFTVYGGPMGQCQGFLMLLVKCTGELANAFLKLFYLRIILGWIARTIFGRFLCVRHFATKDPDFELHVFLGRKVIGRYVSREARWHIDRPFRALVDIQRLSCLSSAKGYPVK